MPDGMVHIPALLGNGGRFLRGRNNTERKLRFFCRCSDILCYVVVSAIPESYYYLFTSTPDGDQLSKRYGSQSLQRTHVLHCSFLITVTLIPGSMPSSMHDDCKKTLVFMKPNPYCVTKGSHSRHPCDTFIKLRHKRPGIGHHHW